MVISCDLLYFCSVYCNFSIFIYEFIWVLSFILDDSTIISIVYHQQHSIIKSQWYISDQVQVGPSEGISMLHEEVSQKPMISTPATVLSLFACFHDCMGNSLCSVDRRREDSGLVYRWLCMICRQHPARTAATLESFSGISLKDSGEGKVFWWAEHQGVLLVVLFAWKEKWPDVRIYIDSCATTSGLAGWLGTWKKHDWKIGDKEVWGKAVDKPL